MEEKRKINLGEAEAEILKTHESVLTRLFVKLNIFLKMLALLF